MRTLFLLLVLAALLVGCASVGRPIDQGAVNKIEKDKSTKEDVLALMGSPDRITSPGDGTSYWTYSYARASAKPATFIPVVGLFAGGHNVQSQAVVIVFDNQGVVKRVAQSQTGTEVNQNLTSGEKADLPAVEQNKRNP